MTIPLLILCFLNLRNVFAGRQAQAPNSRSGGGPVQLSPQALQVHSNQHYRILPGGAGPPNNLFPPRANLPATNVAQIASQGSGSKMQSTALTAGLWYVASSQCPMLAPVVQMALLKNVFSMFMPPTTAAYAAGGVRALISYGAMLSGPGSAGTLLFVMLMVAQRLGTTADFASDERVIAFINTLSTGDIRAKILAPFKHSVGLLGALYTALKKTFARLVGLVCQATKNWGFLSKKEIGQFSEATVQRLELAPNPLATSINTAKFDEVKESIVNAEKAADTRGFINMLSIAVSEVSEPAIYIFVKRLGRFKFSDDERLEICRILNVPVISGSFLAMALQEQPFDKLRFPFLGLSSNYGDLDHFVEFFTPLLKAFPNLVPGVLQRNHANKAWPPHKNELYCVFMRLTFREFTMPCNISLIGDFFKTVPKFPQALNIVVRRSLITNRIMRERRRATDKDKSGKDRRSQFEIVQQLRLALEDQHEMLVKNDLTSLIDMILTNCDPMIEQDRLTLRSLTGWIEESTSPSIYGVYLGVIKPDVSKLTQSVRKSEDISFLESIYKNYIRSGRLLDPKGQYEYNASLETFLLGKVDGEFTGRNPQMKSAIVDLVIRFYFGIHPDKMAPLRPLSHVPFIKQIKKRLKNYKVLKELKGKQSER